MTVRFEDMGFFLCAAGDDAGVGKQDDDPAGRLMIILGADVLIVGLLALRVERVTYDR